MTTIALENLQGWVSTNWDADAARQASEMTKLRAQSLANNQ